MRITRVVHVPSRGLVVAMQTMREIRRGFVIAQPGGHRWLVRSVDAAECGDAGILLRPLGDKQDPDLGPFTVE